FVIRLVVRQASSTDLHPAILTGPGSGTLWTYGILLAVIATVIPSFMLSAGMKRIGANNAAIVTSVGPVSTILQAHFFLGDKIFAEQVVGTVLVIFGVLLIGWKAAKPVGEAPEGGGGAG